MVLIILFSVIFYALAPYLRAVYRRVRFYRIRKRIIEGSFFPELTRENLKNQGGEGYFKFFGKIDSIEQDGYLWVTGENQSVRIETKKEEFLFLPTFTKYGDSNRYNSKYEIVQAVGSDRLINKLNYLDRGSSLFIAGFFSNKKDFATFESSPNFPLLSILYTGEESSVTNRALESAYPDSGFFNLFNLFSMFLGFSILLYLSYFYQRQLRGFENSVVALSAAFLPFFLFVPPAVIFIYLYKKALDRVRYERIQLDFQFLSTKQSLEIKKHRVLKNIYKTVSFFCLATASVMSYYLSHFFVKFFL